MPQPVLDVIKVKGHFYAVPVDIHMSTWIWYSKAAFKKAGIDKEPATPDELFAALDKLKAAGLIGLAHGGQPWQENILFQAMLANVGGKELYLQVLRDRNPKAIKSEPFKKVLLAFKRLQGYVDAGSPNRNWNDATAMLISGKAGVQIMGDWAKGEFAAAKQTPARTSAAFPASAPMPYLIQGDAFVFPKTSQPDAVRAQKLLATMLAPAAQLEFNKIKGSLPILSNVDARAWILRPGRHGDPEGQVARGRHDRGVFTPDQNGALQDVLTTFWNTRMPVEKAQRGSPRRCKIDGRALSCRRIDRTDKGTRGNHQRRSPPGGRGLGTASRVISGKGSVSQSTLEKVRKAIEELEFRPSHAARSLLSGARR
jgi:glucose/mannose transport system substrate-binding protein